MIFGIPSRMQGETMKCGICGTSGTRFTRVNHERYGIVLICDACLAREKEHIRSLPGHRGCGCR